MSKDFVYLLMLFCHIIDDYNLQGWLASAKQKEWWKKNAPETMYEKDYLMALLMHSLSWSFMIMLPISIYYGFNVGIGYAITMMVNTFVHAIVDDLKANKKKINLWFDQAFHLIQIAITYQIFM